MSTASVACVLESGRKVEGVAARTVDVFARKKWTHGRDLGGMARNLYVPVGRGGEGDHSILLHVPNRHR